jgi:hypothetical protein
MQLLTTKMASTPVTIQITDTRHWDFYVHPKGDGPIPDNCYRIYKCSPKGDEPNMRKSTPTPIPHHSPGKTYRCSPKEDEPPMRGIYQCSPKYI